ncbi:MAG: helix-turn-helix domain-containing protein [Streptococcaceae bacterium]|jgi:uncharacterized protein YpbB|nr:helix-turn-helix domain-containing protein [Streptococcaceae bacterium]
MFSKIILAFFLHNLKARPSSLYHLLKGESSIYTKVYGFFYDIRRFIGIFPKLSKETYEKTIADLVKKNYLEEFENEVRITTKGLEYLDDFSLENFARIDNVKYGRMDQAFYRYLLFAIQVVSYASYHEKEYIPLENSPFYKATLKKWFHQMKQQNLLLTFVTELTDILSQLPQETSDYLARQFSGYQVYGKIYHQLSENDKYIQFFEQKEALHTFIATFEKGNYPCLALLLEKLYQKKGNTYQQTWDLFDEGQSIEEIARMKQVKAQTIESHLIHRALIDENFVVKSYPNTLFQSLKGQTIEEYIHLQFKDFPEFKEDFFSFRMMQLDLIKEIRKNG